MGGGGYVGGWRWVGGGRGLGCGWCGLWCVVG